MQINKIKKLKNGKYKLEIDRNKQLTTYDSVILENDLLFNKQIDNELLDKIDKSTAYYDIYNKVLKMVGKKLRSEQEIRDFLLKEELSDNDIENLIKKFKENKIIDDIAFTKAFIHDRLSFSNDGPLKIKSALEKYNIDNNIIESEMSSIDEKIYEEMVKKYVLKKKASNHKYSNLILKYKIESELRANGFSKFNIDDYFDNDNNKDLINKECNKIYKKFSKKYTGNELTYRIYNGLYQKGFSKEEIQTAIENIEVFE